MGKYHIIVWENDFEETNNLIDARDIVKKLLEKKRNVVVISGTLIAGDQFLENVRRIYR